MTSWRVTEERESIYALMDEFLVLCPVCENCARVYCLDPGCPASFNPRRVICENCGYTKDWAEREITVNASSDQPRDGYFGLPLWLQTSCRGQTLWAYNLRHLNLLEAYIGAGLREHQRDPKYGWINRSWMNRLPAWMTSAKNRDAVLKAIAKLRKSLV